jgi:hypothetical protein
LEGLIPFTRSIPKFDTRYELVLQSAPQERLNRFRRWAFSRRQLGPAAAISRLVGEQRFPTAGPLAAVYPAAGVSCELTARGQRAPPRWEQQRCPMSQTVHESLAGLK